MPRCGEWFDAQKALKLIQPLQQLGVTVIHTTTPVAEICISDLLGCLIPSSRNNWKYLEQTCESPDMPCAITVCHLPSIAILVLDESAKKRELPAGSNRSMDHQNPEGADIISGHIYVDIYTYVYIYMHTHTCMYIVCIRI